MTTNKKSIQGQKKVLPSKTLKKPSSPSKKTLPMGEKKMTGHKIQRHELSVSPVKSSNKQQNIAKVPSTKVPGTDSRSFETQVAVLDALLNSSDNILSIVDRKYRIINFNHHFVNTIKGLYGKMPKIGFSLHDFYTNEKDWKAAKLILNRVLTGETVEMESLRGDHSERLR